MKIIEALKKLKIIDDRMQRNINEIYQYAARVSTELAAFGDDVKQKAEVQSRVQSNKDLFLEYLKLNKSV